MSGFYVILDNDLNLTYCYIMWANISNYFFDRIYKSWHWTFEHLYFTFPDVMLQLQLLKVPYYSYVPIFVFLPEHDELSETLQRKWHNWPKHGCLRGQVLGQLGWGISALQSTTPPPTLQFNLGHWLQSSEAVPPIFMSLTGIEPTTVSVGVAYYFCTMLDHWNTVAINFFRSQAPLLALCRSPPQQTVTS